MGRAPCCDKANVKKGPWSPQEDEQLKHYIQIHGTSGNWITLPQKAGLKRCGKSCRLRWMNYLRPNIKHGEFSDDEDKVICTLYASIGSRWSTIATQLPGRTDNDIKNYWNTKLKKKMMSNLITMPEIEKPLHHLQSPNSSTNINNNASSYTHSTNIFGYHDHEHHHHHHDLVLQSQEYRYGGLGPRESYQGVKDSSTLDIIRGDQASVSSNSDGSFHYEHGYNMGSLRSDSNKEFGRNNEKEKGYYRDSSLDSSLEEIKHLIGTNMCTSDIDNNLNFFVDDTKEVEKVMYY